MSVGQETSVMIGCRVIFESRSPLSWPISLTSDYSRIKNLSRVTSRRSWVQRSHNTRSLWYFLSNRHQSASNRFLRIQNVNKNSVLTEGNFWQWYFSLSARCKGREVPIRARIYLVGFSLCHDRQRTGINPGSTNDSLQVVSRRSIVQADFRVAEYLAAGRRERRCEFCLGYVNKRTEAVGLSVTLQVQPQI